MPHYSISWTNPRHRLFDIALRFTAPENDPLLWLPAWRPGRYLVQNYAANVREWSANLRKVGKSEWRAEANASDEVVVSYRFYAGVLDAGSSFLDDDEAYVNPSNVLMCVDALRAEESWLTIAAPAEWRIETQLRRHPAASERPVRYVAGGSFAVSAAQDDRTFLARNYDHLIDSPFIAAAEMTRHTVSVPRVLGSSGSSAELPRNSDEPEEAVGVHFIIRGNAEFEPRLEPMRKIALAHGALFGGFPFRDYRFLIHVGDKWHGVEHEDSSSIIVKRFDDDDRTLSLCSHELFHAWNVKRIVPAAFTPYDYLNETPTRLLWAMEGITSYYGDLLIARAGVWDAQTFFEHLAKDIEAVENAPARAHLSLAQASFDGWLQDPAQMHDRANAWFSFYDKGAVVAALLDLTIRSTTERSLDDVMRLLWREYGETGRGVPEDGIERAVAAVAGDELARDFFARYVDGTEPLPYAELFRRAAVSFEATGAETPGIGAKLRASGGRLMIDSVVRGGAAMDGGLLPGDELIAIDGVRTTAVADVERVFESLADGATVDAVIARHGVVATRTMAASRDPHVSIALRLDGETALRDAWLRRTE